VDRTAAEIEASGGRILGREVTLDVNGVRTRPDLFAELPNGQQAFVEVKTGAGAALTPNQAASFPGIWAGGAVPDREEVVHVVGYDAHVTPAAPTGDTQLSAVTASQVSLLTSGTYQDQPGQTVTESASTNTAPASEAITLALTPATAVNNLGYSSESDTSTITQTVSVQLCRRWWHPRLIGEESDEGVDGGHAVLAGGVEVTA
jgi:hypothetical protein